MSAQIRHSGSIPAVRFTGALCGGSKPAQPRVAYGAMRVERAEERAVSRMRADLAGMMARVWQHSVTELKPAEGTPRLKGVVGWCPRSVFT
ncbi:hypothetical protein F4561_000731 [Lipingzhangella halophila]|uniref:Uncharacterized protein n=1 Tax=Lipingzhangella halophila TaxID=1783352 RepID=A0A7W7W0S0_9ACTN|nr:hypothetical protein [Lipingzhangella halophila]MBB4929911.1 hypothetical protein [Lipingzhangella halophila]